MRARMHEASNEASSRTCNQEHARLVHTSSRSACSCRTAASCCSSNNCMIAPSTRQAPPLTQCHMHGIRKRCRDAGPTITRARQQSDGKAASEAALTHLIVATHVASRRCRPGWFRSRYPVSARQPPVSALINWQCKEKLHFSEACVLQEQRVSERPRIGIISASVISVLISACAETGKRAIAAAT